MKSYYTTEYLGELTLEQWDVIFTIKVPTKDEEGYVIDDLLIEEIIEDNVQLELNEQFDVIAVDKVCDNIQMIGVEDDEEPHSLWVIRMNAYMEKGTQYGWIKEILSYDIGWCYINALNCIEKRIDEVDSELNLKENKKGMLV